MRCEQCAETIPVKAGRVPRYCSGACRQKAYRARAGQRVTSPFPQEMRSADRWVRADGKRPIMADGRPASSTNPRTWAPFEGVAQGAGDGMGFMLGDGFACLDLDHCIDDRGRLSHLAQSIVAQNPGAFIEKSMSGHGLHVFGRLPARRGRKLAGLEVYSQARFIRTTGDVVQQGSLETLKW